MLLSFQGERGRGKVRGHFSCPAAWALSPKKISRFPRGQEKRREKGKEKPSPPLKERGITSKSVVFLTVPCYLRGRRGGRSNKQPLLMYEKIEKGRGGKKKEIKTLLYKLYYNLLQGVQGGGKKGRNGNAIHPSLLPPQRKRRRIFVLMPSLRCGERRKKKKKKEGKTSATATCRIPHPTL